MEIKSSIKIFLIPAILFAVFFVFGNEAKAATDYYVSPSGNDSNSGSSSAPFRTIQKAANVVNPGDTIYVRAGTYNERVVLSRSGTSENYITFQNYPGETAILDGAGLGNGVMFRGYNVSYIKVIGLKIRNHEGAGIHFQPNVSDGFNGSNIEIRNNEIYNQTFSSGYGHAILVVTWPWGSTNSYSDIIVDGNYIHDVITGIPTGYNEALTLAGSINRYQITNNIIDNTNLIGIDNIGREDQYPHNGIISNNIVRNSGDLDVAAAAIYIDGAKNITIENNSVYDNDEQGIFTSSEDASLTSENIIVRKNIVWNNRRNITIGGGYTGTSQYARVVHNTAVITVSGNQSNYYLGKGTNHVAKNNIGYFNSTGIFYMIENAWNITISPTLDYNNYYPASGVYYWYGNNSGIYSSFSAYQTATGQDANSIITDPLFTNIDTNDFTLQSESPAINTGTVLTTVTSAGGTGTSVTVADARYFHDGYEITGVSGDSIMIGTDTVTVTDVDYTTNTITFTPSITWVQGEGVSYVYSGSKPDMGAYEYASGGDTIPPSAPSGLTVQ